MAPHPLPSPKWRPCSIPCADVLSSGGTAALRYEMQAAQIAACVTPGEMKHRQEHQGHRVPTQHLSWSTCRKTNKIPPVTNACGVQIGFW